MVSARSLLLDTMARCRFSKFYTSRLGDWEMVISINAQKNASLVWQSLKVLKRNINNQSIVPILEQKGCTHDKAD